MDRKVTIELFIQARRVQTGPDGLIDCPRLHGSVSRRQCFDLQFSKESVVGISVLKRVGDSTQTRFCRSGLCSLGRHIRRELMRLGFKPPKAWERPPTWED